MSMRDGLTAVLWVTMSACSSYVHGESTGALLLDATSDTISVQGETIIGSACTYEARLAFGAFSYGWEGRIFDEWTYALDDKTLNVSGSYVLGYAFPVNRSSELVGNHEFTKHIWHHVAYIYDGSEERIYVNGQLITSRPASGAVGNAQGICHVGAIYRDGGIQPSFVGYVDALRISNNARYSGQSFTPPSGDLSSDGSTLILYNFNEPPGSTTVTDESGNGHTGTLGVGFEGATSPEFVTVESHSLSLQITNEPWGQVAFDPEPVDPNMPIYLGGASVTLTAAPIEGKAFKHWEIFDPNFPGDSNYAALDSNLVTTIVMMTDREVTVVFKCGSSVGPLLPLLLGVMGLLVVARQRLPRQSLARRQPTDHLPLDRS